MLGGMTAIGRKGQPLYGTAALLRRTFGQEDMEARRTSQEEWDEYLRLIAPYCTETKENPIEIVSYK